MTVPVSIQQARLAERLHIAERLIESVECRKTEAKETEMSLTLERDVERKPMFGAIKRAVLGMPPSLPPKQAGRVAASAPETPHQKVFRLVRAHRLNEACALAASLINSGDVDGFFIYGGTPQYRRADGWYNTNVNKAAKSREDVMGSHSITPEMAQVMLAGNENNRKVKSNNLIKYTTDLMNGRWDYNGSTIVVSKEGLLNDGQNRLFSILLSGRPGRIIVVFGIERDARRTNDIGDKRTTADRAKIRGVSDYVAISAIANLAFQFDNGRAGTETEVDEYGANNAAEIQAARDVTATAIRGLGPSVLGVMAMHLLRLGAKPDDIKAFCRVVRLAEETKSGNPARTIHLALYPKPPRRPEKMKKLEWVSTLCHHFILWKKKKTTHQVIAGKPLPESI